MPFHDGAGPLGFLASVRQRENRRPGPGDIHGQGSAFQHLFPQRIKPGNEALAEGLRHGIPHGPPHKADISRIQAGDKPSDIAPLGDGGMHVHLLGEDTPRFLGGNDQFRMNDRTVKVARNRKFDQVEGVISADQYDAAHEIEAGAKTRTLFMTNMLSSQKAAPSWGMGTKIIVFPCR